MTATPATSIPTIDSVFQALGLGTPDDIWRRAWPLTQATFEPDRLEFLHEQYVRETCRWLHMEDKSTEACVCGLHALRRSEFLQRLAWHFHLSWFAPSADLPDTPLCEFTGASGDGDALFYVLLFLSGVPALRAIHRKRNISESVTRDTLSDLERWMRKYRQRHGRWGFNEISWLRRHFSDKLIALGRLQFEMTCFPLDYTAYRNRHTGRVIVLAPDGMHLRGDGQCAAPDVPNVWTAHLEIDDRHIRGTPLSPLGHAQRELVELPVADWELILGKDDRALSVHIPEEGPMDHAACGESFQQALEFFPRHYPDYPFKAFMCFSWLLDPHFEEMLSPGANIVRFLREFYLLTVPLFNPIRSFPHIFDGYTGDLEQAPQRTSLQRATLGHLQAGGEWRTGGALLFPEDLNWGAKVYRNPPPG